MEKKKIQTKQKSSCVFTSFNEMVSSVGVVLLSSPLFDVFSILSTFFIVEIYSYLCMFYFYVYVYEYNIHNRYRFMRCCNAYSYTAQTHTHTHTQLISEFRAATLFPIRQTSKFFLLSLAAIYSAMLNEYLKAI